MGNNISCDTYLYARLSTDFLIYFLSSFFKVFKFCLSEFKTGEWLLVVWSVCHRCAIRKDEDTAVIGHHDTQVSVSLFLPLSVSLSDHKLAGTLDPPAFVFRM